MSAWISPVQGRVVEMKPLAQACVLIAADDRHLVVKRFPKSQVTSEFVLPDSELVELSTHMFGPAELVRGTASMSSESRGV